jgi:glycosyltransferase involved in cell wall biosynthesis
MDAYLTQQMNRHEPQWARAYPLWCEVLRRRNLEMGAELGVAFGGSSEAVLRDTQVEKLYSIDMFQHDPGYDDPLNYTAEQFDMLFAFVQERLAPFGSRCILVRKESAAASTSVPDQLDFVFLDANHSLEAVARDLRLWAPKVREGGIIGGHDYDHPSFPGVKEAVDSFFGRFGWMIVEEGEGVWWTERARLNTSFVVPAFNCASTIPASLTSIIADNIGPSDEILVVDDASSDDTASVLQQVPDSEGRVRVVTHRYNKGTAAASRNTGIAEAANNLVFCLDADNILEARSIDPLVKHMFASGADIAAFGEIRYFKSTPADVTHSWIFKEGITLADALAGPQWPGPSGNYLFTRQSWLRAGRYHEPTLENPTLDSWVFGIRQLATGSTMVTLPGTWYFHRYGHESHYVQNKDRGSQSLAALIGLMPFLDMLEPEDVEYVFSKEARLTWYDALADRPLKVKGMLTGHTGSVSPMREALAKRLGPRLANILDKMGNALRGGSRG